MLKIRQAEDNFKCDVCGQTFDMHKSSVRHIVKDQQAKDNNCYAQSLHEHLQRISKLRINLTCDVCGKNY